MNHGWETISRYPVSSSSCSGMPWFTFQLSTAEGPQDFYTVAPCRLVDTRLGPGPLGGPALEAQTTRTFDLHGVCGVPASARAVALNVTVTGAAGAGHLRLPEHAAVDEAC